MLIFIAEHHAYLVYQSKVEHRAVNVSTAYQCLVIVVRVVNLFCHLTVNPAVERSHHVANYVWSHFFYILKTGAKVRRKIRNLVRWIADKTTKNVESLFWPLFSVKLRGSLPRHLLEETGEMVGIFKAELL